MKPYHEHHCDDCTLLGRLQGADAYYCTPDTQLTIYTLRTLGGHREVVDMENENLQEICAAHNTSIKQAQRENLLQFRRITFCFMFFGEIADLMEIPTVDKSLQ